MRVLSELGVEATTGAPGRDDLILKFEGRVAVAEVKGVTKSAQEKHAAQLEKWVSEYFTEHGVHPKGILIVNPYCNLPLDKRTEQAFPNQMLKYSTNREHCLLTTVQLLGILLTTWDRPEIRPEIVRSIFDNVGVFDGYEDIGKPSTRIVAATEKAPFRDL